MSRVHDVLILGSGPAGYTAAVYTARANLKPVLFTGLQPGGQLTITTEVENYPGFPTGVMGPELMEHFRAQAARFGTELIDQEVEKVDFSKRPFTVWSNGAEYRAHSVIVATGASAMLLGLPSEHEFMGFGVSACATCDGFFFKGKRVIVVGGGDTAMEEANFLTRFCTEVIVVHRRDQLRASKIMAERVMHNPKIEVHWNTELDDVLGESQVEGVVVHRNTTGQKETWSQIKGVFLAIGHEPNTAPFRPWIQHDETGYLITQPGSPRTEHEGVYACGDAVDKTYRQAVTAAGTGCQAAIEAERWIEAREHAAKHG